MVNMPLNAKPSGAVLCIDDVSGYDFSGRLKGGFGDEVYIFKSLTEAVGILEMLFDMHRFPQSTMEKRSFLGKNAFSKNMEDIMQDKQNNTAENGKKATFIVNVQFRQNATWQGTIQWVEKQKTQRFRSELEMIKLMDEAIDRDEADTVKWE